MLARLSNSFLLLSVFAAATHGQTVVFDGQRFASNGGIGFSPSLTIWDDLQTEFNSLPSGGTLSEISVIATKSGGPTQAASGFFDLRVFDEAGNDPRGVSIALLPFDDTFFSPPNDPFNTRTLIQLDELESMNISIPRDAKLGVGVFFDDDSWTTTLSNSAIVGSSPGDNWIGNFPNERADGGVGDFAWKVTVAETAPTASWLSRAGGEWDDPSGWDTGFVPKPGQDVNALMLTDGLGPLVGPSVDTTVKSIDFRSFASPSTLQLQPGVEVVATDRVGIGGLAQLELNGGSLRTEDFAGTLGAFNAGQIEIVGGRFMPFGDDFLLSGPGDPTVKLSDARFDVERQVGTFDFVPGELRIGEDEGHRGTIEATAGATLTAERAIVGWGLGSAGTLRLSGTETVADIEADVTLGNASLTEGVLIVENDAVLNAKRLDLGRFGVGHATVRGGTINITEDPFDNDTGGIELNGVHGAGLSNSSLQIEAGGVVNTERFVGITPIGSGAATSVVVTGVGSELNAMSGVGVGSNRAGSLRVLDGARLTGGTVGTGIGNNLPTGDVNEVVISGSGTTAETNGFFVGTRGLLQIEAAAAVMTGGITATGGDVLITGPGTSVDASTTASTLASLSVNNGTLRIVDQASVISAGLNIGDFNGTMSTAIISDSRLDSDGLFFVVSNVSPGTLEVRDGGVVDRTGDVIVSAGDLADGNVVVTGADSRFDVDGAIYLSGAQLNGQTFDVQGPAVLRVEEGATVTSADVVEPFTNGEVQLAGGTLVADELTLASGGQFTFSDGQLSVNTFTGNLVNDGLGVVAPGTSTGVTVVTGAYTQGPQASLDIELATGGLSPMPGVDHDQLTATTAQLSGTLSLLASDPSGLSVGDSFLIVETTGGRSGTFGQIDGQFLGLGLAGEIDYSDQNRVIVQIIRATDLLTGDFNGDGIVDTTDYTVWRDSEGQTGADLVADADDSGTVDFSDYAIWATNYGAIFSPSSSFATPEPTTLAAALVAVSAIGYRRRCR